MAINSECRSCLVLAVRTECCHCRKIAWGNGNSCWKCHDKITHRPTAAFQAWVDAVTPEEIARHSQL